MVTELPEQAFGPLHKMFMDGDVEASCACVRGVDHEQDLFDVRVGEEDE